MPVSGNEEIGVKPLIVQQSSDYLAGIPIKKRRYPMVRPPSPPAEEPIDTNSLQKDQTSPSNGSASKSVEPEERKESSQLDAEDHTLRGNTTEVKVEEPKSTQTVALDRVDKAPKSAVAKNPTNEIVSTESNPAASESVARSEVKVEAKTSDLLEKTGLLPSERENSRPVSARSEQNQDSPEPISLNLSLSKTNVVDGINVGGSSSSSSSRLCEDRANWDLNTPMDAWVGPSSALALGAQTSRSETNGQRQDAKPLIPVLVNPGKRVDSERMIKNPTTLSILPNLTIPQGSSSEDSLRLRLSTPTENLNADKVIIPNAKMPRSIVPSRSLTKATIGAVKAEPVEECIKQGGKGGAETSISVAAVKRELVDRICLEALKSRDLLTPKTVDPRPVKPEPVLDSNKQTVSAKEGNESSVQLPDKLSSPVVACTAPKALRSVANSSCSTENERSHVPLVLKTAETFSASGSSLSTESKLKSGEATLSKTTEIILPAVKSAGPVELSRCESRLSNSGPPSLTEKTFSKVNFEAGESSTLTSVEPDTANADDSSEARLSKPPDASGPGSEEEKVNISAEIEVSYGSDYESDGNHAMDMTVDMEIDTEEDYEDGEVRESQELIAAKESVCEKGQQSELANNNDSNTGAQGNLESAEDTNPSSSNVEVLYDRNCNAETGEDIAGASDPVHGETGSDRSLYLQESTTIVETPLGGAEANNEALPWSSPDQSGMRIAQEYEERDSKQVADNGVFEIESLPNYSYEKNWNVMNEDPLLSKNDPTLAKSVTTGVDNEAKDIDNGSQRNRIILLPRSSGSSSPSGTRAFSGRMLHSRNGRERLSDFALEGDKLHSRGRDDIYYDGTQQFSRERHHHNNDQAPPRNTRFNFMRGRGRISNRHDNLRGGDPEYYNNGPTTEFRVPRHKFAGSDLEYNNNSYNESSFVGSGRGGGGGGQFVRRIPARRRSPPAGGRGGSHIVRRISRNISPNNRIIPDEGSDLVVRPRRNVRGSFQDDSGVDSGFSYEGADGHFAGPPNRNFPSSSQQRRVLRRIRSKSPVGSRNRSPGGAWSSPRRRSPPEGFAGGQHHHHHHRSPAQFFRMKSSPERRGFSGEGGVVRRQEMANNRSPSSRIVVRDRRFGGLDTQERPESDDFYGGPMNSNGGDERRFSERRGPVRPYRASFNSSDGEGFHVNSEEGSSRPPLRFCQDDDTEFQERGNNGNLAERDFNRRIKNRPLNAPRRMRNVEDQEVNYRHGNQSSWHNNDFDDMARVKRKRY